MAQYSHVYHCYIFSVQCIPLQHYHAVHGNKEFECGRCGKKFGLRDMCQRHERECGQVFPCPVCGEEFRSRNALYQHTKRKGHREEKSHRFVVYEVRGHL